MFYQIHGGTHFPAPNKKHRQLSRRRGPVQSQNKIEVNHVMARAIVPSILRKLTFLDFLCKMDFQVMELSNKAEPNKKMNRDLWIAEFSAKVAIFAMVSHVFWNWAQLMVLVFERPSKKRYSFCVFYVLWLKIMIWFTCVRFEWPKLGVRLMSSYIKKRKSAFDFSRGATVIALQYLYSLKKDLFRYMFRVRKKRKKFKWSSLKSIFKKALPKSNTLYIQQLKIQICLCSRCWTKLIDCVSTSFLSHQNTFCCHVLQLVLT